MSPDADRPRYHRDEQMFAAGGGTAVFQLLSWIIPVNKSLLPAQMNHRKKKKKKNSFAVV